MRAMGLGQSAFRRVAVIAGATAAVIIAVLFARPIYSAMTDSEGASSAESSRRVVNHEPEIETVSFVTSPTIDANPQFFFGANDGSNGYYAERPPSPR
jgi:hypothetical protein